MPDMGGQIHHAKQINPKMVPETYYCQGGVGVPWRKQATTLT